MTAKYTILMSNARRYTENNILWLTKSQITIDTDLAEITEQLSTCKIYFNFCGVRHQNQNLLYRSKHYFFKA